MALSHAWPLQQAVFSAIETALAGQSIEVTDYVLNDPPAEYVRIDGFTMSDMSPKNAEKGSHSFQINVFIRPAGGAETTVGNRRAYELMGLIHPEILGIVIAGQQPEFRFMEANPDPDGKTQHGMLRYTILI